MSVFSPQHPVMRRVFVFGALLLVYLAYLPGISGALYYDDYSNLKQLAHVTDWASARDFIGGGHAGPLGRPLSLASFALQAADWPAHTAALLQVNVLIHVANTWLLFLLGYGILNLRNPTQTTLNFRVALGAAFLWGVLPLLVSTTLITVQRMTGLAALFGLLGLLGYVSSYPLVQRRPLAGFLVQMGCLGLGTLLSLFSKENGALMPCFALVIEAVLLKNFPYPPSYRRLLRGALLLCLLVVLAYISPLRLAWFEVDAFRGFSPWQRLNTEVVILWEYLRDAFLPQRPVHYGPFRDAQDIITGGLPLLAAGAWLGLLALALFLNRAKGFAWLLFGLLWFWTGHLLESTTPLLELTFEHRNYLALYGFCLMLSWSAWHAQGNLARLAPALFMAYTALLLAITAAMAMLWGQPGEAAQRWAEAHPGSARAALHTTFLELGAPDAAADTGEDGPLTQQKMERALYVLDRTGKVCPDCLNVKFQSLVYACRVSPGEGIATRLEDIRSWAKTGDMSYAVADAFFPLHDLVRSNACGTLTLPQLLEVAEAVLENPKSHAVHAKRLHFIAAMIAQSMGDDKKLEWHLSEGERTDNAAMPILQFQVHHFVEKGRFEEASQAIARRRRIAHLVDDPANGAVLDELDRLVQAERAKPRQ